MALGLTQPLSEMSARNIYWGKGGRCVGLTTLPPSRPHCLKIWELQPPGILGVFPGLKRDCFTFYMCKNLSPRVPLTGAGNPQATGIKRPKHDAAHSP